MDVKEVYIRLTNNPSNSAKILTEFFSELFSVGFSTERLIMFSKLIKLYGTETVFNALLDIYGMQNININSNLFPLFNYVCKKYALQKEDLSDNLLKKISDIKSKKKKPNNIGEIFE